MIHPIFALPILLVGWLGFHRRRTVMGGLTSFLIATQGLLAIAALSVFQKAELQEGVVFLWLILMMVCPAFIAILVLALRQYYTNRTVEWDKNEEIRH